MRLISFSILFAVFAILFHGVASADAPAQNQNPGAADNVGASHHFRLRARVAQSPQTRHLYHQKAKDLMATARQLHHNTHSREADKLKKRWRLALKRLENAKSEVEKKIWDRHLKELADKYTSLRLASESSESQQS